MAEDQPSRRELGRMNKSVLQTKALDLGVSVDESDDKANLIEKIVAAGGAKEDPSEENSAETAEEQGFRKDPQQKKPNSGRGEYHLMVASTDDDASTVDVSVNGHLWRVPRDKWVKVPAEVVEVLNNAVHTRLEQDGVDEDGRPEWAERHSRRFSFQAMPAAGEVA